MLHVAAMLSLPCDLQHKLRHFTAIHKCSPVAIVFLNISVSVTHLLWHSNLTYRKSRSKSNSMTGTKCCITMFFCFIFTISKKALSFHGLTEKNSNKIKLNVVSFGHHCTIYQMAGWVWVFISIVRNVCWEHNYKHVRTVMCRTFWMCDSLVPHSSTSGWQIRYLPLLSLSLPVKTSTSRSVIQQQKEAAFRGGHQVQRQRQRAVWTRCYLIKSRICFPSLIWADRGQGQYERLFKA